MPTSSQTETDAYYVQRGLKTFTPYAEPNLRPRERQFFSDGDIAVAEAEKGYHLDSEKVFCHLCGAHRHNKGVVARLSDGSRILFGKDCATNTFGKAAVDALMKHLTVRKEQAENDLRIIMLRQSAEPLQKWVNQNADLVRIVGLGWSKILENEKGPVSTTLRNIERNRGRLVEQTEIKVRGASGATERSYLDKIIASFGGTQNRENLRSAADKLLIAEGFLDFASEPISMTPTRLRDEVLRQLGRLREAAVTIDDAIAFTADLMIAEKRNHFVTAVSETRLRQLHATETVSSYNPEKILLRAFGTGVESPLTSLETAVGETTQFSRIALGEDTSDESAVADIGK